MIRYEENFMVDLETLGTGPNAMIVAIGACTFRGAEGPTFYRAVDMTLSSGDIDPSTVKWWLEASDQARAAITASSAVPLYVALADFALFLSRECPDEGSRCIWGNGATFDNVILASAYSRSGMKLPWRFWNDRCFRTLKSLHLDVPAPTRIGTHHHALDDALHQTQHARIILEKKYG